MKYALFDYYHGPNHPRKFAEHIEQWAFADGFMNYAFVAGRSQPLTFGGNWG